MENITIEIGGRTIPLRFKMDEFAEIEEEIGNMIDVKEKIMTGKKRIRNIMNIIRIMGNAGLKHAGEKPDITNEWLNENMKPNLLMTYQVAILAVMTAEGASEAQKEYDENSERDLVLEEIQKKKEPTSLHTDGSSIGDSSQD